MFTRDDTIAAIATAPLAAAIGIVRISGPLSAHILGRIVRGTRASSVERRIFSAEAIDPATGEAIDEVICFHCKGPHTATGEDTAEIQGHGGPHIMKMLLDAVIRAGAVPAHPGEFTYRAYRNGRFDLTQAEAVMGLIGARSDRAAKVAMGQLDGALGRSLRGVLDQLVAISAELEAGLDYPQEDLVLAQSKTLANSLRVITQKLAVVRDTYKLGGRLTDGARVAIVGPPNAGKSSLLNSLVGEDRALVDASPGTTRDVVEGRGEAGGIPLLYLDTAGLRSGANRVERRGIEKTRQMVDTADLVILVVDGSQPLSEYVDDLPPPGPSSPLIAANKSDLESWKDPAGLETHFPNATRLATSATTGQGIDGLGRAIGNALLGTTSEGSEILTTARQHRTVGGAVEYLEKATSALDAARYPELAAADLREARDLLADLFGTDATSDMLGAIFENFCVGK